MPIRIPVVNQGTAFKQDVEALRAKYPEIDSVVSELTGTLVSAWNIPHRHIEGHPNPQVCGVALDYPPHGSGGLGALFATYSAVPRTTLSQPLNTYTLLTLTEWRRPE